MTLTKKEKNILVELLDEQIEYLKIEIGFNPNLKTDKANKEIESLNNIKIKVQGGKNE